MLSHSGLKTRKFVQSSANWPKTALIAPKWLLVGLVTQTNSIDVKTVFILAVFKTYRTSKSNNLSFDHNNLIKNPILFCKFLSSLKSHRNGFVFKICVWISVFRRKQTCKTPILGCRDICKISTATFFLKHPVGCQAVSLYRVYVRVTHPRASARG